MTTAAGTALGFDPELLSDLNTALTEACNNVILHAYGGRPGPLAVELGVVPEGVEVGVCDLGSGIRQAAPEHDGLKVGLALMSALADRAEFINVPDGGTEVRLSFRDAGLGQRWASGAWAQTLDMERALRWQAVGQPDMNGEVILSVSPVTLLGPVLGRIGRTLAPSAGFSLQRCYDVYLLTDALGVHAERAAQCSSISVALGTRDRRLEFAVSPLRVGTSGRLDPAASSQVRDELARLSDDISVSSLDSHEMLRVSMRDHLRA
jgi:serine/threonine-protein kinase RsbW